MYKEKKHTYYKEQSYTYVYAYKWLHLLGWWQFQWALFFVIVFCAQYPKLLLPYFQFAKGKSCEVENEQKKCSFAPKAHWHNPVQRVSSTKVTAGGSDACQRDDSPRGSTSHTHLL